LRSGNLRARQSLHGQAPEHEVGPIAHVACRIKALLREPLEEALGSGRLQQSGEARIPRAVSDCGPARERLCARRRHVHDRTVQALQRGLERWGYAGTAYCRIDRSHVDLYRARVPRAPAHQRRQGLVLSRRDLAQPDRTGRGAGLCPLEVPPQPPAQTGEVVAADEAQKPLVRCSAHCGANLRSGSAARDLARPSQVQRET
jgi:hypothetical protein